MEDELAAPHSVVDPFVALDVPLDQLDLGIGLGQVRAVPRSEVVEDAYVVPSRSSRSTRCEPMNPPPPVTNTLPVLDIPGDPSAGERPRHSLSCALMSGGATFRAAVVSALLGALLILGTWDGLYSRLDLPQALPRWPTDRRRRALALAFLLWSAGSNLALRRPVAIAERFFYRLGRRDRAWLIFGDKVDLGIGDRGWVTLIVAAVVLAVLAGAGAGRSPRNTGARRLRRPSVAALGALPSMSDH